jgi:hypothetical protein
MKYIEPLVLVLLVAACWLAVLGVFWDLGNGSVVEASLWRLVGG